jgi:shikimate dehydrogenase
MALFGLIGFPLSHSFSKAYFTQKFADEHITGARYELFELPDIASFPALLAAHPNLKGLNVTIPHKQTVIPFLDKLDPAAAEIGAVNTIKIDKGKTTGFNTDYIGFLDSLQQFYPEQDRKQALVLGSGGASRAVQAALKFLQIPFKVISRQPQPEQLAYAEISEALLQSHDLIINTSPLGMYPEAETFPPIPYEYLTDKHFLYDLVYNPAETVFLQKGKARGAKTINGLEMLHRQAEAAWQIWNSEG